MSASSVKCYESQLVALRYPDWWSVAEPPAADGRVRVYLEGLHEGASTGQIGVEVATRALRAGTFEDEVRHHADQLQAAGYHLSGSMLLATTPISGFDRGLVYNPLATYGGHDFDCVLLAYENANYVALLSLITASRDESPEWWEANKQAFDLVRDTLRIGPAAAASTERDEAVPEPTPSRVGG